MEEKNIKNKKPEIIVIAGPNGSGKSSITKYISVVPPYINADNLKAELGCTDLQAAVLVESIREECVKQKHSFTFETVLSTERNLILLEKAKEAGFFIRGYYILTNNPYINVERVKLRVERGGHSVPEDKIVERYNRCLRLVKRFVDVCDRVHIYDNTIKPELIYNKKLRYSLYYENDFWPLDKIKEIVGK